MIRTPLFLGPALGLLMMSAAQAERGADGEVRILYWQAPSTLNPFLSNGRKDVEPANLIVEPLARFDPSGALIPWLAQGIPTTENGGINADSTRITWRLKEGVTWSDGTPLTSADVKFTYEYCTHPEGGCAQQSNFQGISAIDTPDDMTVVISFDAPMPNPYVAFVGALSPVLQAAQFADCLGAAAATCTDQNFGPIGTGPFVVEEFRPNDVITYSANPLYREPDKPYFGKLTIKGGGDAAAAARAVLETGEFDYAWNQQLSPDLIDSLSARGNGTFISDFGTLVERIMLNQTNPDPALPDDERSVLRPHPFLQDPAVYQALSLAIDRPLLVEVGYGPAGRVTCNWVPAPAWNNSDTFECAGQDLDGANALLDAAGIVDSDGDGIRERDGVPLRILFATATNDVRQDFQILIKQWWSEIGVETELRHVNAGIFFGGDAASPDTFQKFYADVQMYANTFPGTDPQGYLARALCDKAPTPDTQWQGENIARYCSEDYEALYAKLQSTVGRDARAGIIKQLNDMVLRDGVMIPLVHRGRIAAKSNSLGGVVMNAWDTELWNIADWYRVK